jgi:MoxR-like ATPase
LSELTPELAAVVAASNVSTLTDVTEMAGVLRARCTAAVQGRDKTIGLILVALLGDGHVLLEDYPGSGKTTLAKSLGESFAVEATGSAALPVFRRVQFTPDLLPSDVTGVTVFEPETSVFQFRRGPVFTHVFLADEINRTSPKVQAALLESMGEKQVTVDDVTYPLGDLFFVIATQNPLDLVGTYPLPLAQLDRFLFKIRMTHLERDAELDVLSRWTRYTPKVTLPKVSVRDIVAARILVHYGVRVDPSIHTALVDIARATREDHRVLQGLSTRALVWALPALQARAVLRGRDHVTSDDLAALMEPLFAHRIEVAPGVEDVPALVRQCAAAALEQLSRRTLR